MWLLLAKNTIDLLSESDMISFVGMEKSDPGVDDVVWKSSLPYGRA